MIYQERSLGKMDTILADNRHPLFHTFELLPSGNRLRYPALSKNRTKQSFIPQAISLFNKQKPRSWCLILFLIVEKLFSWPEQRRHISHFISLFYYVLLLFITNSILLSIHVFNFQGFFILMVVFILSCCLHIPPEYTLM